MFLLSEKSIKPLLQHFRVQTVVFVPTVNIDMFYWRINF